MKKISNILGKDKKAKQQYNTLDVEESNNANQDNQHQTSSQSPPPTYSNNSNTSPRPSVEQEPHYAPISRTGKEKEKQPPQSQPPSSTQLDKKEKKEKKEKKDAPVSERRHTTSDAPPKYNKSNDSQYEDKVNQLKSMFDTLDDIVIRLTLDDCQGNVERSIDSLLNIVALAQSQKGRSGRLSLSEAAVSVKKKISSTLRGNGTATPPNQELLPPGFDETIPLDQQLIQATKSNNTELVQYFFKDLKPLLNRDVGSLMNVCVIIAIEENNETMLKLFLDNGADSNGDQVMTPLLAALENTKANFARLLIEKYNANVNKSITNLTPLHLATKHGYADLVKMMIQKGATINRVDIVSGKTALHFAVDKGILPSNQQFQMVSALLEGGCDLGFKDVHGETPLHVAARQASNADDLMVLCLLLERAQENPPKFLNATNTKSGDTVLHMIVDRIIYENLPISQRSQRSKIDGAYILDLCLRYFPDPECRNASGKTPLEVLKSTASFANPTIQKEIATKFETYIKAYRSGQRLPTHNNTLQTQPAQPVAQPQPVPVKQTPPQKTVATTHDASDEEETQLVNKRRGPQTHNHANNNNAPVAQPAPVVPVKSPQQIAAENQVKLQHSLEVALIKKFRQNVENALQSSLEDEYSYIEKLTENSSLVSDFTSALQPFNIKKNRYKNILPFENTRVKLTQRGYDGSDFISASYIQIGIPGSDIQYIATQGPLEHTINDFWRMLWEQQSNIIVMLANQIENGKEKVAMYWPRDDQPGAVMETDIFVITLLSVEKMEDQIIARKIRVINKESDGERDVYHIQYTGWPDQGIPENPKGFIGVLGLVDDINVTRNFNNTHHQSEGQPEAHPPMIVHCSAGIGRSGVFCSVHSTFTKLKYLISNTNSMLASITGSEDYKESDDIPASLTNFLDFKDTVLRMRQQRVGLVQTKDQYVFCYMTLKETLPYFEKLISYKNEKWFHKNMNLTQATQLVGSKPLGAFLFRESNWPGSIMLTVQTRNGVTHYRVSITLHGFTLENETNVYPSLVALVESHQDMLMHPLLK